MRVVWSIFALASLALLCTLGTVRAGCGVAEEPLRRSPKDNLSQGSQLVGDLRKEKQSKENPGNVLPESKTSVELGQGSTELHGTKTQRPQANTSPKSTGSPIPIDVWARVPSVDDIPLNRITNIAEHEGVLQLPESIKRVVVWADMHGDLDAFMGVLKLAGINVPFTPEEVARHQDTLFVSTGDYMDRGDSDLVIFQRLVEMKQAGFNLYTIVGNHENMVAIGDWRYRDLSYMGDEVSRLSKDKEEILSCNGKFNKFVREHSTPLLYLRHEKHDQALLMMHGGISKKAYKQWSSESRGLDSWTKYVNRLYKKAALETCNAYSDTRIGFQFSPEVNPYNYNSRKLVSSGKYGSGEGENRMVKTRTMYYLYSFFQDEFPMKLCGERQCDPSWDRSFFNAVSSEQSDCNTMKDLNKEFDDVHDGESEYPRARVVVGHSIVDTVKSMCKNHVFALDTAASRMMGWPPGQRTIMVFDNFGSAGYASQPKITAYYTRSDMYNRNGQLVKSNDSRVRAVDFHADGTTSPLRVCRKTSYLECEQEQ